MEYLIFLCACIGAANIGLYIGELLFKYTTAKKIYKKHKEAMEKMEKVFAVRERIKEMIINMPDLQKVASIKSYIYNYQRLYNVDNSEIAHLLHLLDFKIKILQKIDEILQNLKN